MHEIEDTEASDAASELVWPQYYKHFLRFSLRLHLREQLGEDHLFKVLRPVDKVMTEEDCIDGYAQKIVIGAENGADKVFEAIHASFSKGAVLPWICMRQKSMIRDRIVPESIQAEVDHTIRHEYGREHLYTHVYEDDYQDEYSSFEEFVANVSKRAVVGIINGAEDMYGKILRSLYFQMPLPPARRLPRAMKGLS
jgi:hypothetical protein